MISPSVAEPERLPEVCFRHGIGEPWPSVFPVGGHCRATFQSAHMMEYGYLRVSGVLLLRCPQIITTMPVELSPLMYRAPYHNHGNVKL